MANTAPSRPRGNRATGNFPETSRRQVMLGGLALAPIAALPFVPATLGQALEGNGSTLSRPISTAELEHRAQWAAAQAQLQIAESAFEKAFDALAPVEQRYYDGVPEDPIANDWRWDFTESAWAEKEAARAKWRNAVEAWREASGLKAAERASSDAANALHDARLTLIATPAPDLAHVAEKLRFAHDNDIELDDLIEPLNADLARLA